MSSSCGRFPWTRWLSDDLLNFITDPLLHIGKSILDYLPSLIFLVILGLITRYGLRLIKLYFAAVERGRATLPNFDSAWSLPTYKLIRTLVIGIALVMAYPYLPGSGSEALRGISVFAGLLRLTRGIRCRGQCHRRLLQHLRTGIPRGRCHQGGRSDRRR